MSKSCAQYVAGLFLLLLVSAPTKAQQDAKPWETKDWREWTKQECRQILEDSPWAKTEKTKVSGNEQWVRIQLYSALPTRQALARRKLIAQGYDKADPAKKLRLEQQAAAEFPPSAEGEIAVRVEYGVAADWTPNYDPGYTDEWGNRVYNPPTYPPIKHPNTGEYGLLLIAGRNGVRSIRKVAEKKTSFILIFPRIADGEPVLKPEDRSFEVWLVGPARKSKSSVSVKVTLKEPKPGEPGYERAIQVFNGLRFYSSLNPDEMRYWGFQLSPGQMTYQGQFEF